MSTDSVELISLLFSWVQERFAEKDYVIVEYFIDDLLNSLLYCRECGEKVYITYSKNQQGKLYHTGCSKWRRFGKDHCTTHRINEEILNEHVVSELRRVSQRLIDSEALAPKRPRLPYSNVGRVIARKS